MKNYPRVTLGYFSSKLLTCIVVLVSLAGCVEEDSEEDRSQPLSLAPITNNEEEFIESEPTPPVNKEVVNLPIELPIEELPAETPPVEQAPPQPAPIPPTVVSWNIPSERENGDDLPLYEIGGYEIIYTNMQSGETHSKVITDSSITNTEIESLSGGEWAFQVATFDERGLYSEYSDPVYKNVGSTL